MKRIFFSRPASLLLLLLTLGAGDALDAARDAFVKGQYKKAIQLAEPLTASQPTQAWRIIGASRCFLKDRSGAKKAWAKLDPQGQAFLKYVCARNAVSVP